MYDFRKVFSRLLPVILFAVTGSLLILPLRWPVALNSALLLSLNLLIILSATYFGSKGAAISGAASVIIVLLHNLRQDGTATLPIILLGTTIAIFYISCLRTERFMRLNNTHLGNIEEERNVLSVELEHLRMEGAGLNRKLQRYAVLKGLTQSLNFTFSLDELSSLITNETFGIIGKSSTCLLYLVDREKQELSLSSTSTQGSAAGEAELPFGRRGPINLKKGDIFDNWVFKQRGRLMIADTMRDFRFNIEDIENENKRGVRSLLSVPLIRKDKLLGILRLDSVSKEAYDSDDLRLLDIISDLAAIAIENMTLYQATEQLAITDGLTGLFVRRYFLERFDAEISRAVWTNSQFAFLMLDIDNFKSYNDRYGHIAGDILLKQIAELINASVNPGDIVARYGGEEFAVLLVDTSMAQALKVAGRIRERVEKERFILRRKTTEVRISGGIAFFSKEDEAKENLIQKADQALYRAKTEGKNRICPS